MRFLLGVFTLAVVFPLQSLAQDSPQRLNVDGLARSPAFSHATTADDLVFVSGTLGTVGESFSLVQGGVADQTRQALRNIQTILEETGSSKEQILKCNVYLARMNDFDEMNQAYAAFFDGPPPARTTIGANGLALGALVEIECIARKDTSRGSLAMNQIQNTGFVSVGNDKIYFESTGEGPAVVFAHGLGGNHAVWYQQVPDFASRYRVVTWDQRGFGRSTNDENESSPATAVEDLKTLLDHLEIDKAHLIGQSMGGWAVLGFAIKYPERVHSIVMADTIGGIYSPFIEEHFDQFIRRAAAAPPPEEMGIGRHPALGEEWAKSNVAQAFLYKQISSLTADPPQSMGMLLRTTAYEIPKIKAIQAPALFVVGEDDPIFPPEVIRDAASKIEGSQVIEVGGAGHSPYFERPARWNKAVLEFLQAVR